MSTDSRENHINYVELPAPSAQAFAAVKQFYKEAFGWSFQDWGEGYSDTKDSGTASGFSAGTMKFIATVFLIAPYMSVLCLAQPIRLTGLDHDGTLTWTNLICTTQPVYEVLKAHSVEGSWEHLLFVTNQASVSISNVLNTVTGAVFFRLAWVDEPPLVFDYAFTEPEFGLTTVTGRLEVTFTGPTSGRRSFAPTEYYELSRGIHPIGEAPLALGRRPYSRDGISLRVFLAGVGGEGSLYLDGVLERSEAGGRCAYIRYSGAVWWVGFQTEGIGTFIATRVP